MSALARRASWPLRFSGIMRHSSGQLAGGNQLSCLEFCRVWRLEKRITPQAWPLGCWRRCWWFAPGRAGRFSCGDRGLVCRGLGRHRAGLAGGCVVAQPGPARRTALVDQTPHADTLGRALGVAAVRLVYQPGQRLVGASGIWLCCWRVMHLLADWPNPMGCRGCFAAIRWPCGPAAVLRC